MRPHPSLVFSLEEEMAEKKNQEECQPLQNRSNDHDMQKKLTKKGQYPAVTTAKMMHAYRDAQIMKQQHEKQMKEEENEVTMEEESNHNQSDNMQVTEGSCNINKATTLLPFELPQLRVDLASLVEPPLMTSWLPSAEGIDTSYYYRDE
jgi:hypothetical protein